MEITSTVSKHDNFQIEFKTVYPIQHEHKMNEYSVDVFFFLPRNLAVNQYTFSSHEFYNDFSEYIRFKTPDFSLKTLVEPNNPVMEKLLTAAEHLDENKEDFNKCLKMFCSILKSSLRDSCAEVIKCSSAEDKKLLSDYLANTETVLGNFRALKEKLASFNDELQLFELADEFLSLTVNRYAYDLWKYFSKQYPEDTDSLQKIVKLTFIRGLFAPSGHYQPT